MRLKNNCSGLKSEKEYSPNYICQTCTSQPSPQVPDPPNPSQPNQQVPDPQTNQQNQAPPQPQSADTNQRKFNLKILQFNCNGIKGKISEILNWMEENKIKIAALQETKLMPSQKDPNTTDYTIVRADRDRDKGGGLAFLVHKSIQFQQLHDLPKDNSLESQGIKVNDVNIINLYIPPNSSCPPGYTASISNFLHMKDTLILGDLNAHDTLWHSQLSDDRGRDLADEIGNSDFGALNEDNPTRLTTNGQSSSPDVSLASLTLLPYSSWEVNTNLSSDHLPITIKIQTDIKPITSDNRTYINFRKANWQEFKEKTEEEFSKLPTPTNAYKDEIIFRKVLNKVSNKTIPSGRIKSIIPDIPTEAADKIKERDNLRQTDPDSQRIPELNREIESTINKHKRDKWRETIENKKSDTTKLFKLIKHLNGGKKANDNEAIKFKGKYITTPKKLADKFNKQYSSVIPHKTTPTARRVTKNLKKNPTVADTITTEQTREAIKKAKASKALGPDKISTLHLKHLGDTGIKYLTDLFNISIQSSTIPAIWKTSTIIPLLKPGKPANESTSYRPVSLLCPSIKILERILLPTLTAHLPVPDIQHGFRAKHSTVSALHEFTEAVAAGFNERKPAHRTLLVQIDMSKAFDMVSHEKLLDDLNQTTLPDGIKRWFNSYLSGRQSRVNFRNATSNSRNVRTGVPQGAVTSPILFNFYLSNLPPIPDDVFVIQYADDISIFVKGNNVDTLSARANTFLAHLADFLDERQLVVSPEKSTVTWFTPATAEANLKPNITIKGVPVRLEKTPKLLGVTYDTMFCFGPHIKQTVAKAKKKLNLLKSLAGSSWGCEKETILITYKSIVRSILEYASPVWSTLIKDTHWTRLQSIQNQALRIASGCLSMSAIDHLHAECKVMPLREHCMMTGKQYLAACHLQGHPGRRLLQIDDKPRLMKKALISQHGKEVRDIYNNSTQPSKEEYKKCIKSIHTKSVQHYLENSNPNKVLNSLPPTINQEEKLLPRSVRSELARLRSGYSRLLNSYLSRIDPTIANMCPLCQETPHDTHHIFNCSKNQTDLTVINLWTKPKLVAHFLKLNDDQ